MRVREFDQSKRCRNTDSLRGNKRLDIFELNLYKSLCTQEVGWGLTEVHGYGKELSTKNTVEVTKSWMWFVLSILIKQLHFIDKIMWVRFYLIPLQTVYLVTYGITYYKLIYLSIPLHVGMGVRSL